MHYQKVFRSPINTSVSKNIHSIPRSQRFQKTKRSQCSRSFYDIKSTFQHARTTSLGLGDRSQLANQQAFPDPAFYNYDLSPFSPNKIKKRGFSFSNSPKPIFPFDKSGLNNPGPGKYRQFFDSNKGFTIRSKYEDPLERGKNTLGPGQYKVVQNMSKTGVYFNSRFKNSFCGKIGREKRFSGDETVSPGPGAYKYKFHINRSGSYFDSRIKSNMVSSFQGTQRPSIIQKREAPGPGAYYYFSQFGSRVIPQQ